MMEKAKFTYFSVKKAFEKQTDIIGDEQKKKLDANMK